MIQNKTTATTRAEYRAELETSLARLSEHDWHILSNTWSRGIDWIVSKVGRKWKVADIFGAFPLFKTKRAAYDAATNLILLESRNRAAKRAA